MLLIYPRWEGCRSNARGGVKKIYIQDSLVDALTQRAQFLLMQDFENKSAPTPDKILSLKIQVWTALVEGNAQADRAVPRPGFPGVYLWERRHDVWINSFDQDTSLGRT